MRIRWISTSVSRRSAWLKICAACMHACMVASVQCIGIVDVMFRIYIARIRISVLREWKSAREHGRACMRMGW